MIWQFGVCPSSGFRQNLGMLFIPMILRTFIEACLTLLQWFQATNFVPKPEPNVWRSTPRYNLARKLVKLLRGGKLARCGRAKQRKQPWKKRLWHLEHDTWRRCGFSAGFVFFVRCKVWIYCYIILFRNARLENMYITWHIYIYKFIFQQIHILIM